MPMVQSKTDGGCAAQNRAGQAEAARGCALHDSTARRLLRRMRRSAVAACGLAALGLAAGFGWFLWSLPADEIVLHRDADGIVVLTGGASRIADAIELLAAGRGKRLLISGVNRNTTSDEITRLNPDFGRVVSCCVDFDRSLNTLGNAIETRHWVETRGFRSLIVVTSSYHMPRAMLELAHQLPGVTLIPYPVVTQQRRAAPWWSHPANVKILALEYFKYIVASARIGLDAPPGATTVAASRGRAKI